MIQHEEHFHDDVKLVLIFSTLTRLMLRNMQDSPIARASYESTRKLAYSWFSQLRSREGLLAAPFDPVKSFYEELLTSADTADMAAAIGNVAHFLLVHDSTKGRELAECLTNPSYFKRTLKTAWDARRDFPNFETWYAAHFPEAAE